MSVYKTPILVQHLPNLAPNQAVKKAISQIFVDQQIADYNYVFFNSSFENLSIDMAREIGKELAYTNFSDQTRFLVIYCLEKSSLEAQNALLKNLEEPPANTQIILTTTDPSNILPTIFSRVEVYKISDETEQGSSSEIFEKILQEPLSTLLELTEIPNTKEEALNFFKNFLFYLDKKIHSEKEVFYQAKVMQKLIVLIELLQKNVNIKLAVDNFFLEIKKT